MVVLPLEDDRAPRQWWEWLLGVLAVGACVLYLAWKLHVVAIDFTHLRVTSLVLRNTTANGGDMGAHVYWPWFLEHNWFTQLRIAGWSPAWYSGFPIGQYYFPFPALLTSALDVILPYNVAFKIVTVLGPLLLPVAAYHLADQLELPWPSPPLFSVATLYYELELRTHGANNNTWTIYGGNLASALAGEYSFTLALALALFFLAALAHTFRTGRRPWLPAVLLAAAVTSHIVVALFAAFVGVVLWLLQKPVRTWRIGLPVGAVALALSAVWVVPLLATNAYTSSMRYEKKPVSSDGNWIFGFRWWLWVLLGAAVVGAAFWRRRNALVLIVWAVAFALAFWLWPKDLAIWNTRFIPFYFLAVALLAALGVTELVRLVGYLVAAAIEWVGEGDRLDRLEAYERARTDLLASLDPAAAAAERAQLEAAPWTPPELQPRPASERARRRAVVMAITVLVVSTPIACFAAYKANRIGGDVASGWSQWNYSGYEAKGTAWTEYRGLVVALGQLPCGRVLWEPSAGDQDAINAYGTSLALELLPYWTNGCIGSQEGLYFEASATKDAHFLTVSELAQHPSDPVRGLVYGSSADFSRGVHHAQMLGVRYLLFWTPESQTLADHDPDLRLVKTAPNDVMWSAASSDERNGHSAPGWKAYEIKDWSLAEGLAVEPVVAKTRAGTKSTCFHVTPDPLDTKLTAWECATDPWWMDDARLDQPFAESGPSDWLHVDAAAIGKGPRRVVQQPARVSNVVEAPSGASISFSVDQIGKPVVVKASFFPNWTAHGARGPWRLAPNLMVVIPTRHDVRLTYDVTGAEWLGRLLTLLGVAGLVLLVVRFRVRPEWTAGGAPARRARPAGDADGDGHDDTSSGDGAPTAAPAVATVETTGAPGAPPVWQPDPLTAPPGSMTDSSRT